MPTPYLPLLKVLKFWVGLLSFWAGNTCGESRVGLGTLLVVSTISQNQMQLTELKSNFSPDSIVGRKGKKKKKKEHLHLMYCSGGKAKCRTMCIAIICISKKQTYLWMFYLCRTSPEEYSRNVIVSSGRESRWLMQQKQESAAFVWLCFMASFVAFKIMDKLFKERVSVPGCCSCELHACVSDLQTLKRYWGRGISSRGGGSF